MSKTVTIIVPTIGRDTLIDTLYSFHTATKEGDHVVVVDDGIHPLVGTLVGMMNRWCLGDWQCIHVSPPLGCWGHPGRNRVLPYAQTDLIWTIDDDDVAAPGALDAIREQEAPWTIYRMHFGENHPARGTTCWRAKELRHGDVGTPMIVAKPSDARFGHRYEGDYDYMMELNKLFGAPEWDERIIVEVRP